MKHLFVVLLLLCSAKVFAQDVILKKDGSTIVCRVIEVNDSEIVYKKFSALEGSNYVMAKSFASAINYENGSKLNISGTTTDNSNFNKEPYNSERKSNNGPKTGCKGFLEAGYTFGLGFYGENRITFLATAGWQINPNFFVGIGSGENYFTESKLYGIPIYADFRANIYNNGISPFFDIKAGYSIADVQGFYFSPSVGCRLGSGNNTAFTISIGYELQKADCFTIVTNAYDPNGAGIVVSNENVGGITIKVGFEF